nr:GyrI-like domain-containing protein [Methylocystis bryophila]
MCCGVEVGATPAGKALKFEHRGPYEDIESTYEAITAFLDEKGLETKDASSRNISATSTTRRTRKARSISTYS